MRSLHKLFSAVLLAVAAAGTAAAQDVPKLKFATTEPPQSIATRVWAGWIEKVNAEAKGHFSIELFAGGALGRDPRNQLELVMSGGADMGWGFPFFTPGKFPDNLVVSLPLIIRNAKEGSFAIWRLYERKLLRGWDDVMPVFLCTPSPVIVMSTKPVPNTAALRNLRSSASTPLQMQVVRAFGAAPVSGFNFSNSAEALSRGVLDFDLIGYTPSKIFKQFDVAKHVLEVPLGPSPCAIFMNKASYEKLSPQARAILDRNRGLALAEKWAEAIDGNERSIRAEWQKDSSRTLSTLSDEEMKKAEAVVEPIIAAWAKGNPNGPALVKALREEVQRVREGK